MSTIRANNESTHVSGIQDNDGSTQMNTIQANDESTHLSAIQHDNENTQVSTLSARLYLFVVSTGFITHPYCKYT